MKIFSILMLFVLSGCSTTWMHSSNSENDFYRDQAQCSQQAQASNPITSQPFDPRLDPFQRASQDMHNAGANLGRAIGIQGNFSNCMMAKGYRKQ